MKRGRGLDASTDHPGDQRHGDDALDDAQDEAPVVLDEGETQVAVVRAYRALDERRRRARARVETRPSYKWWVLGAVLSGLFATGWTITSLTAALPFIRDEFGTGNAAVSWVVAAPFLLRSVFVPAFGKVGDLAGRKRVWMIGFAASTLFNVLSGFAPNIGFLIVTRVLAAVAGAAVAPTSMALIAEAFEPEERVKAMGYWSATIAVSPLAGVITGGFLIEAFSWRWLFYSQFPFGIFALVVGAIVLRESKAPVRQRFDYPGAVLSIVGLGALLLVCNQGADWGWTSSGIMWAAAIAVVGISAFAWVETHTAYPVLPVQYLRNAPFMAAVVMNAFGQFAYMGSFFITSLMFRDVFAYTAAGVSLAVAPRAAALGVMGPLGGAFTKRLGGRRMAVAGMVCIVGSTFLLATVDAGTSYLAGILPGLVIAGFGLGLIGPQASATVTNVADPGDLAAASGALAMFVSAGQSMGIALMQAMVAVKAGSGVAASADAYSFSYFVAGVVSMVGLAAAFFIPNRVARPAFDPPGPAPEDS